MDLGEYLHGFNLKDGTEVLICANSDIDIDDVKSSFDAIRAFFDNYGPPRTGDRFLFNDGSLRVDGITFGSNVIFIDLESYND